MRRIAVMAAATAALAVAAPPASAAPHAERETFKLSCDNGKTYVVAVNTGMGAFTPARIVGTKRMLIPIAFGDFHFTARSPEGEVLVEGSEPGETKGSVRARSPRPRVTCTFEETFVLPVDDPEFGLPAGTIVTFSGEVTAFLSGRR